MTATPASAAVSQTGQACAAIVAAGIGSLALALLAAAGDASAGMARALTFYAPTGPLSGVTTSAIVLWLVSWWILARRWRRRAPAPRTAALVAFALLAASLLLTFPPFEDLLLGK